MAQFMGVTQLLLNWDDPPSIGQIPVFETIEIQEILVVSKGKKAESGEGSPVINTCWAGG